MSQGGLPALQKPLSGHPFLGDCCLCSHQLPSFSFLHDFQERNSFFFFSIRLLCKTNFPS